MLHFFRKMRQKFLAENRLRQYVVYAMGEIILVVIGILLALQINSWNQAYKDRKAERYILKSFMTDLDNDIKQLSRNIEATEMQLANLDTIVQILEQEGPVSKFFSLQRSIHDIRTFDPSQGTYDESLSSGKLQLISNNRLREHTFNYYRDISRNDTDEAMRKIRDDIILPYVNNYIYNRKESIRFIFNTKAELPRLDLHQLAKDEKYYGILIAAKGRYVQVLNWKNYLLRAEQLRNSIGLELE